MLICREHTGVINTTDNRFWLLITVQYSVTLSAAVGALFMKDFVFRLILHIINSSCISKDLYYVFKKFYLMCNLHLSHTFLNNCHLYIKVIFILIFSLLNVCHAKNQITFFSQQKSLMIYFIILSSFFWNMCLQGLTGIMV